GEVSNGEVSNGVLSSGGVSRGEVSGGVVRNEATYHMTTSQQIVANGVMTGASTHAAPIESEGKAGLVVNNGTTSNGVEHKANTSNGAISSGVESEAPANVITIN